MANKSRTTANLVSNTGISTFTDLNITRVNITGVGTISNGSITNLTGTAATITTGNFTTGNIVTGVTTNFNATNVVIIGVTTVSAGTTALPSISPSGDSNTGIFFPAADTIAFSEGGTEAVRIDSSGNINIDSGTVFVDAVNNRFGVGTTSPNSLLSINPTNSAAANNTLTGSQLHLGSSLISGLGIRQKDSSVGISGLSFPLQFATIGGLPFEIYTTDAQPLVLGTNSVERMRITSTGNFGIGITNPGGLLHLQQAHSNSVPVFAIGESGGSIRFNIFQETSYTGIVLGDSNVDLKIKSKASGGTGGTISFWTSTSGAAEERMRITSGGNLLVGATSAPGAGTDVTGAALNNSGAIVAHRAAATTCFFGRSNDGEVIALYSGTTPRGQVSIAGAVTTYGSFSDYRLKENIKTLTNATEIVSKLKPKTFNFIEFPNQLINGFIAHEVQEVIPEAITGKKDAVDADGKPVHQGIDQSKLVPVLTAALQEAIAKIESLEQRLTAAGIN